MSNSQPGILAPVPGHGRYLEFNADYSAGPAAILTALATLSAGPEKVIGVGPNLAPSVRGHKPFPADAGGPGADTPSTQADIWCWLRGDDRGRITHAAREITNLLAPTCRRARWVDAFKFDRGLDLTGYEDGTENPDGDDAVEAAIVSGAGAGLDGSSFVATQQWRHDFRVFDAMNATDQDDAIGRRKSDNVEFEGSPASAHVKRTAQESFEPEAFIVRRSMPWADANGEGLMFVAFGKSLNAFEVQLRRMTGQEDGVIDGLYQFTHPVSGSYFWCPPVADGHLDFSALKS